MCVAIYCDGYAATNQLDSVKDKAVNRWLAVKFGLAFSDILRFAAVARRAATYCETLCTAVRGGERRTTSNAYQLAAGFWNWVRQLRLHHRLYPHNAELDTSCCSQTTHTGRAHQMAEEMVRAGPVKLPKVELQGLDGVKHHILSNPKTRGALRSNEENDNINLEH